MRGRVRVSRNAHMDMNTNHGMPSLVFAHLGKPNRSDTALTDGAELQIVPAIAGGA